MEENMVGMNVKFNLGATRPKVDALKTRLDAPFVIIKLKI
jgi:hypothetical protein